MGKQREPTGHWLMCTWAYSLSRRRHSYASSCKWGKMLVSWSVHHKL